ncbi:MAG: tandem-95 repeat protein, partial [Candidatus Thorarchaeota archaeon]
YTPNPNWHGSAWFTYDIYKRVGSTSYHQDRAYVYITVIPVNDAPVGVDDSYTIDEDTSLDLAAPGLLGNDYDVDGDAITLDVLTVPTHGSGSISADGSFSYNPNPNWYGTDSLTYRVFDGTEYSGIVTVTITVNPVNDAPVGVDDEYTIDEDGSLNIAAPGVLSNDYDVDGDTITAILVDTPYGSGSFSPNGALSYYPPADWHGVTTLTYQVFDGTDYSGIVTVTITVNPVNDAPVGVNDSYTIDEDTPLILPAPGVLSNDYDVDGDTLTLEVLTVPAHGSGSIGLSGSFSYTPESNWYGTDSFTYRVFDGTEYSGIVTVAIIVNPVNDAPVGVNDSYTIDEDTPLILPAPGVLSNDYDVDGDTLTLEVLTVPAHGSGSIGLSGSFSYTPESNWYGTDSFTYRVYDGIEYSGVVIVTVTVKPINDAPVAVDDVYTTDEDVSLIVAAPGVLGNDHDIDSDSLIAILIDAPLHGSVTFNADGSLNYVPDADWYGVDTLMYQVFDGTEHSNIATVTITVAPVNDAPVAEDDAYTTDEDTILLGDLVTGVLANDFDIDGDIMAASLVSEPSHGILTLNPDGSFSYIPDANWYGVDSFVYEVSDGALTDTATVTITVNSVNDSPVAVDDAYPTEVGVPLIVAVPGVLANDYDIDNDPLEALLIDSPMHGTIVLVADGSFAYAPDACWCGVDTFSYKVFDGFEYSNIALVTLTVIDVTPPVTMVQFTGVEGEYGWYHSDVEVTLTATDDASGVASTVYSLNGFTWIPYSGPFVLSNPGEVTVYYYSTDNAGNVEDVKSATIKIGKPTRSFVTGGGWIYDSGEKGHFAFVVKYKCGVLKGHLIYSFKADGYKYIVKSTHWFGMAIDGNHALLEGNAKIMRYSYETRKWECFGNFYFRVEIWDNGKCKRDIFQIQIFDKSCELFHEAGFDPLGEVHHGSIQIHEHGPKCWCRCWCMKKWR